MRARLNKPVFGTDFGPEITRGFADQLRKITITDGNAAGGDYQLVEDPDDPSNMIPKPVGGTICTFSERSFTVQGVGGVPPTETLQNIRGWPLGININDMSGDEPIQVGLTADTNTTPADISLGFLQSWLTGEILTWNNFEDHTSRVPIDFDTDQRRQNGFIIGSAGDATRFYSVSHPFGLVGVVGALGRDGELLGTLVEFIGNTDHIGEVWYLCFETPNTALTPAQSFTTDGFIETMAKRHDAGEPTSSLPSDLYGKSVTKATILTGNSDWIPEVNDRIECDDFTGQIISIYRTDPTSSYYECIVG